MVHLCNHHCHTLFSDGKTSPEAFAIQAIKENLVSFGFSDHAPIPDPGLVCMEMAALPDYLHTIDRLRDQLGDQLQIYTSLEVDYIPGVISVDSAHIAKADLDYTIGAVHYIDQFSDGTYWSFESGHERFQQGLSEIFEGDTQAAIRRYYSLIREMVTYHRPDVVAHLDRIKKLNQGNRYFNEDEKWYRNEILETLEVIAKQECIMEVNTKGYYKGETNETYPGKWILQAARSLGIAVHLASDAHHPEDIRSGFGFGLKQLQSVGYQKTLIMLDSCWQDSSLIEKKLHIL